ncbi:hypothetical protein V1514DRAFT_319455 [Lipomyces japonicus]|uniref:uncharacterized protein n=1 Tax=Lipomyces japonicus TaxID=56871 RepID=UPI0034CD2DB3
MSDPFNPSIVVRSYTKAHRRPQQTYSKKHNWRSSLAASDDDTKVYSSVPAATSAHSSFFLSASLSSPSLSLTSSFLKLSSPTPSSELITPKRSTGMPPSATIKKTPRKNPELNARPLSSSFSVLTSYPLKEHLNESWKDEDRVSYKKPKLLASTTTATTSSSKDAAVNNNATTTTVTTNLNPASKKRKKKIVSRARSSANNKSGFNRNHGNKSFARGKRVKLSNEDKVNALFGPKKFNRRNNGTVAVKQQASSSSEDELLNRRSTMMTGPVKTRPKARSTTGNKHGDVFFVDDDVFEFKGSSDHEKDDRNRTQNWPVATSTPKPSGLTRKTVKFSYPELENNSAEISPILTDHSAGGKTSSQFNKKARSNSQKNLQVYRDEAPIQIKSEWNNNIGQDNDSKANVYLQQQQSSTNTYRRPSYSSHVISGYTATLTDANIHSVNHSLLADLTGTVIPSSQQPQQRERKKNQNKKRQARRLIYFDEEE